MKTKKMKQVTLKYASGWVIRFRKYSNGPILFLEWLQNNQPNYKHQLEFSITTDAVENEILEDDFVIRWKSGAKEMVHDCYEYIKGNI